MQCDFCETKIPAALSICPHCGHAQKTAGEKSRELWSWLFAVIAMIAILIAWHHVFPHSLGN
jgi:hypothetical protein